MPLWMAEGGPIYLRRLSVGQSAHPVQFTSAFYTCHANFYNDWTDQEHLETYLPGIQRLVHLLLEAQT